MKHTIAILALCSLSCTAGAWLGSVEPACAAPKNKRSDNAAAKADKKKDKSGSSSATTSNTAIDTAGYPASSGNDHTDSPSASTGSSRSNAGSQDDYGSASTTGDYGSSPEGSDSSSGAAGKTLQGKVEDTGVAPVRHELKPIEVPIPVPVVPGGVEQEPALDQPDDGLDRLSGKARKDGLHGTASDTGTEQQALEPKMAPDEQTRLQGTARVDDSGDPDTSDQELMIEWDRWRNRFLRAVQLGAQENMNNPEPEEYVAPRFDPQTGIQIPRYPMGTSAWFSCMVTPDRRVTSVKIVKSSGFASYDAAIRRAVREMDGRELLNFPRGSRRKHVFQEAAITTSTSSEFRYHKFNDVERYSVPNQ